MGVLQSVFCQNSYEIAVSICCEMGHTDIKICGEREDLE